MMMHRTRDTYSLTDFREKTGEHLARLAEGRIETITQNGEAAMVVMSPERYDFLVHAAERGHIWKTALDRLETGERGRDAREVVRELADEFGVTL
jgi:antitoxin (DNA-binding transcriptional repressor) of toxin-antitoxin stability system